LVAGQRDRLELLLSGVARRGRRRDRRFNDQLRSADGPIPALLAGYLAWMRGAGGK